MLIEILKTVIYILISMALGGALTYLKEAKKTKDRLRDLEKWRCYVQEDTDDSADERKMLLWAVLACLKGLQEQGCNGPVTAAISELETYINEKAHRPRSFTKEADESKE